MLVSVETHDLCHNHPRAEAHLIKGPFPSNNPLKTLLKQPPISIMWISGVIYYIFLFMTHAKPLAFPGIRFTAHFKITTFIMGPT